MTRAMHLQQVKNKRAVRTRWERAEIKRMQDFAQTVRDRDASMEIASVRGALRAAHEATAPFTVESCPVDLPPPSIPVTPIEFGPVGSYEYVPPSPWAVVPEPPTRLTWIGVTLGLILALVACAFAAYWWA